RLYPSTITGTAIGRPSGRGTRCRHGLAAAPKRGPLSVESPVVMPAREHALGETTRLVEGDLVHELFHVDLRPLRHPLLDAVRTRVVCGDGQEWVPEACVELRQVSGSEGDVQRRLPERGDLAEGAPELLGHHACRV